MNEEFANDTAKFIAWSLGIIVAIGGAAKVLYSLYKYIRDADERHDKEQAQRDEIIEGLQYSKACQSFIMQRLGICWYIADEHGLTFDISENTLELYKCKRSQVIGVNWMNFVVKKDKERIKEIWHDAYENGQDFDDIFETSIGDGSVIKIRSIGKKVGKFYFGEIIQL